jgi:hypothetical protein
VALDGVVRGQFQTPTDLVPTKASRYRQNGRLRGPRSPQAQRVSSRTQAVTQPAVWSHSPLRHAQGTGSSPHFGGTYRPSSFIGTHSQLMKSTRLYVKITQELRLTGMTNASDRLYDQGPGAYSWQFTVVEWGHTTCLYLRSVYTSGSMAGLSLAETTPCKLGQCDEKC